MRYYVTAVGNYLCRGRRANNINVVELVVAKMEFFLITLRLFYFVYRYTALEKEIWGADQRVTLLHRYLSLLETLRLYKR